MFLQDLSGWGEGPWQRARTLSSPLPVLTSYLAEIPQLIASISAGLSPRLLVELKEASDFLFALFFIGVGVLVWRLLKLSFRFYYLLSLVLMLSVGTLKGVPRFGLVLFPGFLALAKAIKKPWFFFLLVSISTAIFVLFLLTFSMHYWVA